MDTSTVTEKPNSQQGVLNSEGSDQCDHGQQEQIPNSDQQHHQEILPTLDPYVRLNKIPEDEESPQPPLVPKQIGDEGVPLARYSTPPLLEVGYTDLQL